MASYLLLRSNKESGPYNLQDLVNFGLKPYDLVWVEGKSAAWRYPSELEELKPYAPGTEEQPYDRFFKKPSQEIKEEKQSAVSSQQSAIGSRQSAVDSPQSAVNNQQSAVQELVVQEKFVPKRSVFVTMPVGKQSAVDSSQSTVSESAVNKSIVGETAVGSTQSAVGSTQSAVSQSVVNKSISSQQAVDSIQSTVNQTQEDNLSKYQPKPVTQPQPKYEPQSESSYQPRSETPVISVTENPAAQIKYSQPLDEIKEMYVKTLQERKNKIARKGFLLANLKRASVIVVLVALGVLAGFILKSNKGENRLLSNQPGQGTVHSAVADPVQKQAATNDIPTIADHSVLNESLAELDKQKQILAEEKITEAPAEEASRKKLEARILELEKQQALQQPPPARTRKETTPATGDESSKVINDVQTSRPVQNNPATGERSRTVRSDNDISSNNGQEKAIMPKPRKSALSNLVSVSSNDYKRVAFGGIRNLELTVVNDSRYVLDKVIVELQYLKPSEEPLKTELVQFHSVSPNGSLTMKIKDTNRGIKVSYRIIDIQSAQEPTTAMSGF